MVGLPTLQARKITKVRKVAIRQTRQAHALHPVACRTFSKEGTVSRSITGLHRILCYM